MKATGIVRKIDPLGRVVLPKELRNTMGLPEGTPMEIFTDADSIVIRKYQPTCAICGSSDIVERLAANGVKLCRRCISEAM